MLGLLVGASICAHGSARPLDDDHRCHVLARPSTPHAVCTQTRSTHSTVATSTSTGVYRTVLLAAGVRSHMAAVGNASNVAPDGCAQSSSRFASPAAAVEGRVDGFYVGEPAMRRRSPSGRRSAPLPSTDHQRRKGADRQSSSTSFLPPPSSACLGLTQCRATAPPRVLLAGLLRSSHLRIHRPFSIVLRRPLLPSLAPRAPQLIAMASSDIDMLLTDAPPRLTRRRSNWSRCEEAVARVAPTATTTCQVCHEAIAQGQWEIGLMFIHVEGFMLMEWHHIACTTGIPGIVVEELLETVQSEMATEQKQEFQAAVTKCMADAPPPRPSVSQ